MWEELEGKWVDRFCARHHNDMNLWMIPPTEHLLQDYRAIQGSFKGQQVFVEWPLVFGRIRSGTRVEAHDYDFHV